MLTTKMAAILATLLVLTGCGSSGEPVEEVNRAETVPVALAVTMKGAINVAFRETVMSKFVLRRTNNKDQRASQVLGIEPEVPIKYGSSAFLAGVGIVPYLGDNTYTIPVGSPIEVIQKAQETGQDPQVQSSIKVDWWPTGLVQTSPEDFLRRAKPCTVVVKNEGHEGTLTCPDVTNEAQDKHFSLILEWKAPPSEQTP